MLLENAGTKCWMFPYRHCSPENQTVSPARPGENSTSSSTQSTVLSYENTTLWPLSTINCIIVAFVFSKGKPFRKPIYTNCEYNYSNMYSADSRSCLKIALTGEAAQERMLWIFLYLHQ